MTVRDLINALLGFDPSEEVNVLNINSGEDAEAVAIVQVTSDDDGTVQLEFNGDEDDLAATG